MPGGALSPWHVGLADSSGLGGARHGGCLRLFWVRFNAAPCTWVRVLHSGLRGYKPTQTPAPPGAASNSARAPPNCMRVHVVPQDAFEAWCLGLACGRLAAPVAGVVGDVGPLVALGHRALERLFCERLERLRGARVAAVQLRCGHALLRCAAAMAHLDDHPTSASGACAAKRCECAGGCWVHVARQDAFDAAVADGREVVCCSEVWKERVWW